MSAATCRTLASFCHAFACSGSVSTRVTTGALPLLSRDLGVMDCGGTSPDAAVVEGTLVRSP